MVLRLCRIIENMLDLTTVQGLGAIFGSTSSRGMANIRWGRERGREREREGERDTQSTVKSCPTPKCPATTLLSSTRVGRAEQQELAPNNHMDPQIN